MLLIKQRKILRCQINKEISKQLNFYFNKKEKFVRIYAVSGGVGRKEEIIHLQNIPLYISQLNHSFLIFSQKEEFQPAYYSLKKIQKLLRFTRKNLKNKKLYLKEYIFSLINEVVFLKENQLVDEVLKIQKELLLLLKKNYRLSITRTPEQLSLSGFLEQFRPKMEISKLYLRTLLSKSITFSEKLQHKKAIKKAELAVQTIF